MNSRNMKKTDGKTRKIHKNGMGIFAALKHYILMKKLGKIADSIDKSDFFTENEKRYLRENYPKIEQCMYGDFMLLVRVKGIKTCKGEPFYMTLFRDYVRNSDKRPDEEQFLWMFEAVNSDNVCPTLRESSYFPLYIRMVMCREICRYFIDGEKKKENKSESFLRNIFEGFEMALTVDENDGIKSNPTEKILCRDSLYCNSTDYTRASCRKNLEIYARKNNVSETLYALRLEKKGENFTSVLCDKPFGGQMYIILHIFLTVLFTFFLCVLSPIFVFSAVPVYRIVKTVLDRFFTRFVIKGFTEPALELSEIPDGKGIMVTVTAMLSDTEHDDELILRLENMYFSCGEKNVYFALLCDTPDSDVKMTEKDVTAIKRVTEAIVILRKKHGDIFYLFVRDKQYSQSEKAFIAPERKRGAVNSLCAFLCGKQDDFSDFSVKPSENVCSNIKYVFTLDADTNLAFDCVRKTLGIMLHPNNRPVIDKNKNCVIKGYGILQPKMQTSLPSSVKSFFTWMMCGAGGVDSYSSAGYDLPFALFGKGVFCGKGMFDKDCFYEVLCKKGSFKNNTVLSHDAPEGALLRCISTSHVTLTDGYPREQMSYYKRRHRWIRGDIQNLHFFSSTRVNGYGERIKNSIDFVSKYLMAENIADALLPYFSFVLILLSLFCEEKSTEVMLVSVAVSPYIIPFVHSLVSSLRNAFLYNLGRLFYSKGVYGGIWQTLFLPLFYLSSIAQSGYVCFDAVFRALNRMVITKKHTLEWTTAAQSDRESRDGILGYVKKNLFSAFFGTFLVVMTDNSFVRLVGLMWMALAFFAYYSGLERKSEKYILSDRTRRKLSENLWDMWQYFEDTVNENTNFLPVDNVSFDKEEKTSFMTSPTNIGLYLASAVVVLKGGFISLSQMKKICKDTFDAVEKLPKYKGLLYNWYDVRTMKVLRPYFVSSVDEGNYLACLYTLYGAMKEYEKDDEEIKIIQERIKNLIREADLKLLYNSKRKLFYIGFTVLDDERCEYTKNCYDMLMSETRILSYIATAQKKVESSHYLNLSRPLIEANRFTGLASWSGTVFEYFMPTLFLPVYYGSLTFEALKFAYSVNVRYAKESGCGVFGISESCYNMKDDSGNYMYHAFGNEKMALCVFGTENVVSPYSSYLMLEQDEKGVLENLLILSDFGMYGKYGFYESCDFERHGVNEKTGVVKSYMSHHTGMSICALGNLLFDGYVRKCFMNDGKNKSCEEFLQEKIPASVYIKKRARKYYPNLSKPVLRPNMQNSDKEEKSEEISSDADEERGKFYISVRLSDKFFLYSQKKNDFFDVGIVTENREYKTYRFETQVFNAVREGAKIITVKTDCWEKMSFEVSATEKCFVSQEAGGVIFEYKDRFYYAVGLCRTSEDVSMGICNVNEKNFSGKVFFDDGEKGDGERLYTFILGVAKSFDTMYYAVKRISEHYEKLEKKAEIFYDNLRPSSEKASDTEKKLLGKICPEITSRLVLPTQNTDLAFCAKNSLCFMYGKSNLREFAVKMLVRKMNREKSDDVYPSLLVCAVFCCYCTGLEKKELCNFIDNNTDIYRIVIRQMTFLQDKSTAERDVLGVYESCVSLLEEICGKYGDDAAKSIVSSMNGKREG